MIAEVGHYALLLALALALVQATLPQIGAWRGVASWVALAPPAALAQLLFVAVAFAALMAGYVTSDFSISNVAANSHTAKPLLYKVAGVWGNHEGSLILWVLILALFGAAVSVFGANLPPSFRARVLSIQGAIAVGFLLFTVASSNPFERLDPAPFEGNGLNPLLQDPGLAFHPPFLYLGYVGFSMAFAFAIAALLEGRVEPTWGRWVRPWTLAAWCALTLGIALGSWWAYYELGWGGFWFWDPVENASFMPWLAGTALLHSAIVVEKRDTLKSWTILLAIITFSLSLLGTFLVRSGVLTSVHAFATDPARGVFILGFLLFVIGGSLALYAVRAPALKGGGLFAPISREGSLVLNNLLLATACATVFLGTLYPLFLDAVSGGETKVSVGPPYFNGTFLPIMAPVAAAMAVGPFLPWKRGDLAGALGRLKAAFAIAIGIGLLTWAWQSDGPVWAILASALAAWLFVGALTELAERIKLGRAPLAETLRRARHLPRAAYGMTIAHAGVAVVIVGLTGATSWQSEKLQIMRAGETVALAGYELRFEGVRPVPGPNYDAMRGRFTVSRGGRPVTPLEPETRVYTDPPMDTTEAAIRPTVTGDLYAVVGDGDGAGGFATRLYYKPFVHWIWLGAGIMMVGGLISLTDRRHRVGAPARPPAPARLEPAAAE
ncbi:MAG: heme lyase CcmF/NrfE family subunit [Alphaproteobacteria bacterium]|nr:heme lyase CcmF/NrfE family subunit [Alphaproteobacteria bacterium]